MKIHQTHLNFNIVFLFHNFQVHMVAHLYYLILPVSWYTSCGVPSRLQHATFTTAFP